MSEKTITLENATLDQLKAVAFDTKEEIARLQNSILSPILNEINKRAQLSRQAEVAKQTDEVEAPAKKGKATARPVVN